LTFALTWYIYIINMYTRQASGERRVETGDGTAKLYVHLVGPHPILKHFLGKMDFQATVSDCLGRTREGLLDHAQALGLLVKNILLSPAPLYRLAQWAEPVDPEALGLTRAEKASVNDDRIARALDALASSRGRSLFFHLAVHIIRQFELDTRRIHNDTTTVTFYGQYERSVAEPRITHGMNKDHRPDMKQLVFGLNVTADGAVPLSHEVYSGNRSDDTTHRGNIERLRQILGRDDFIYVADSKLCTRKNLAYMEKYGGKFVTVMPRSRAEDKRMRALLREGKKVRWRRTLVIENKKRRRDPPDIYWTSLDFVPHSSEGFKIVWCKSSQKARIDALARDTDLRQTEIELHDLGARLNRGKLKKRAVVRKAVRAILDQRRCGRFLHVSIASKQVITTRYVRPGRPRPGDPVREIRSKALTLAVSRNKQALKAEARTDGVFPLLTNLETTSRKQILLIYKYQPYVEKRHALFKTELGVAPVFIKKPHRAAGLIHATFLAMMLDALIERTVRLSMIHKDIDYLPLLPEGRLTRTPTTARVLEAFSDVAWYEFERGGEHVAFPIELNDLQKTLLRLLGMEVSAYG
jgi:transposase